jgi:two-component system, cell cycle sensor histidine kinase and response regulator CckA
LPDARAGRAVRWTGLVCAALGVVVVAGWWLDAPMLVRLGPTLPAMQVATALAFVAAGAGLATTRPTLRRSCGAVVALIGLTTIAGFLFDSPLVLHRLFALPVLSTGERNGLMAPTGALAFCFVGVGLQLTGERRPGMAVPVAMLALVAAGTTGLALIDLACSAARALEVWSPAGRQMAVHTAGGLAVLGFGLLLEARTLQRRTDATPIAHALLAGCVALAVTFAAAHAIRVSQMREVQRGGRTAMAAVARTLGDELVGWSLRAEDVARLRRDVASAAPGYVAALSAADSTFQLVAGGRPRDQLFVERMGLALRAGGTATLTLWPGEAIMRSARRAVGLVVLVLGSTLAVLLTVALQAAATARARAGRLADALASLAASEARLHESRKMEAVARLAGGMAHEFNNLLSVVRGYTQLLGAETDAGLRASYVAEIDTAATRGAELTRRLLTVSARHVLHVEPVQLGAFLADRTPMLRRVLGADRRLEIDCAGAVDELTVSTDPAHLEQSLVTLAANAREATASGGVLSIRAGPHSLDTDTADALRVRAGWYVELEVADSGRGMTPDQLRSIFEPFGGSTKGEPGAGLGLAALYGFARQSGGAIEVVSRVGRGTTFRILLPRTAAALPRPAATEPARRSGARLVLVAEDEDAVRGLIVRILARAGYEVIAGVNGIDALARIAGREDELDVLLTDMVMPELGGVELAEALRARRPELPVLFVSGYADADIHGGVVLRDSRTTFLQKPFSPTRLLQSIRGLHEGEPGRLDALAARVPASV